LILQFYLIIRLEIKVEMSNIKDVDKDIEEYLELGISFLHGIDKPYKTLSANIKKDC